MNYYRDNWFYLTIIVFIGLSFYMGFWGDGLSYIQKILMFSFMSLLVHQYEEYVLPGGAPIIINKIFYGEKENFRRYPGNMKSIMIVNTSAYVVYILAIIFPELIWLGLGTIFFSLSQFFAHGIKINYGMKSWYNPGLASVIFLFIPISIHYMEFVVRNQLVTGIDWFYGILIFFVASILTIIFPVQRYKEANSPYEVPQWQVDAFDKVKRVASLKCNKK